jgi:hypothetical protein
MYDSRTTLQVAERMRALPRPGFPSRSPQRVRPGEAPSHGNLISAQTLVSGAAAHDLARASEGDEFRRSHKPRFCMTGKRV